MPVTKATYTQDPTWTAAQAASLFRTALIDAGLMTDWHDTFLSGSIENRVMAVAYNGAKTYGTTYYWFQFTTTGIFLSVSAGWNAGSDQPSGTINLDYISLTTSSTSNHSQLVTLSATTALEITRYTSQSDARFSFFVIRNGSNYANLHISRADCTVPAWIDLDKVFYHPWGSIRTQNTNNTGTAAVGFQLIPKTVRRSFACGSAWQGTTITSVSVTEGPLGRTFGAPASHYYLLPATQNNAITNYRNPWAGSADWCSGVWLPYGFNAANPAYATNETPVFTGLPLSLYIGDNMPSDFGIAGHYANNTIAPLDTFTIAAGSNVWDVLWVNNANNVTGGCTALFLARTT